MEVGNPVRPGAFQRHFSDGCAVTIEFRMIGLPCCDANQTYCF
jgi:hypothetical protein